MSIQTLTQTLSPLSVFPSRQNYTSSSAYGLSVETWLNEEHVWNGELISLRGQLNTSIEQFNDAFLMVESAVYNVDAIANQITLLRNEVLAKSGEIESYAIPTSAINIRRIRAMQILN